MKYVDTYTIINCFNYTEFTSKSIVHAKHVYRNCPHQEEHSKKVYGNISDTNYQ